MRYQLKVHRWGEQGGTLKAKFLWQGIPCALFNTNVLKEDDTLEALKVTGVVIQRARSR